MRASIKSLDIEGLDDPEAWPEDIEYFAALIVMTIGPDYEDAGEFFSCTVCSPLWFAENVLKTKRLDPSHEDIQHPPKFGRHYLFATRFNEKLIVEAVRHWVTSQEGVDWQDLAVRLSRNLAWEFEDYREYVEAPQ
ncbi:Imm8 family immunity protein [Paracoccus litorisediminis]|uniref:Immunity protein 8 n=1 Tax=Paracoccus litorisediminis TaxID=2006130 RepID=A0A844HQW9_9RHOB|nr:Imm8 family immunity protein [Paracoccus litorisediminis]MTH61458.1 hypothetical protein [Paracoccus litorisediminis]